MTVYRPEFEQALRAFARISEVMKARGADAPVLVGGAAVELYSSGALATGDFDIVTPRQQEFEKVFGGSEFVLLLAEAADPFDAGVVRRVDELERRIVALDRVQAQA